MLKTVLWFFGIGLVVAIALDLIWWAVRFHTQQAYAVERVVIILWPSSIFLMTLNERESWTDLSVVYGISFLANGVIYGTIGLIFALARRLLGKLGITKG